MGLRRQSHGVRASLGHDPHVDTVVLTVLGPSQVESGGTVGEGGGRAASSWSGEGWIGQAGSRSS